MGEFRPFRCRGWIKVSYGVGMDRPSPDPAKLLAHWMEWERGDVSPGTVMKNLKHGGLRDLLEQSSPSGSDVAASVE